MVATVPQDAAAANVPAILVPSAHVTAATCAIPRKHVAQGFSDRQLPLGLDSAFDLKGGGALGPDGLALDLPLKWSPGIMSYVAQACRDQSAQERPWFWMPPVALSGRDGVGRTHIGRTIARCAGVPFAVLDARCVENTTPSSSDQPDVAMPSEVVLAMASSRCANPIILVVGLDGASPRAAETIASMIARESAPRWVDEAMEAVVDLSDVSWLIQTSDADALPPSCPADLRVIELAMPDMHRAPLLVLSLLWEVAADLHVPPARFERLVDYAVDLVRSRCCPSVAELHRIMRDAVIEYDRARG